MWLIFRHTLLSNSCIWELTLVTLNWFCDRPRTFFSNLVLASCFPLHAHSSRLCVPSRPKWWVLGLMERSSSPLRRLTPYRTMPPSRAATHASHAPSPPRLYSRIISLQWRRPATCDLQLLAPPSTPPTLTLTSWPSKQHVLMSPIGNSTAGTHTHLKASWHEIDRCKNKN